ncbi:RodZ domain-containing protein [Vibrio ezurae]|uniref:Cytoskeleton protein RodZ n=1 Tax=Vibrio ezurae NBRC 102218 TaxID=1219080 RepID=U3CJR3_9VIBR|nr:RodZ domain-containing protein [Vibrio ezurae]GAD78448.1 cytoskeleton protein RodZ [Vibrio ezurae NBRC 102218]
MNKESNNVEEQHSDSIDSDTNTLMVGDILRAKRESLGISQKEIADRLRLRLAIVQGIENNDFQVGQVHTFTRGYVRSYARAVGADEKAIVELLDSSDLVQPHEESMQSFSQQTKKTKHDNNIMKLTWGIFTVILGISAVWWWQSEQNTDHMVSDSSTAAVTQSVDAEASEPSSQTELVAEPQLVTETTAAQQSTDEQAAAPSEKETVLVATVPTDESTAQKAIENAPKIAMSFTADCWVQIQDVHGKTLWTGVKKKGQKLDLDGEGPFKFVLGAPEVVSLSISGEPIDLSRYTAGKVARFTAE